MAEGEQGLVKNTLKEREGGGWVHLVYMSFTSALLSSVSPVFQLTNFLKAPIFLLQYVFYYFFTFAHPHILTISHFLFFVATNVRQYIFPWIVV